MAAIRIMPHVDEVNLDAFPDVMAYYWCKFASGTVWTIQQARLTMAEQPLNFILCNSVVSLLDLVECFGGASVSELDVYSFDTIKYFVRGNYASGVRECLSPSLRRVDNRGFITIRSIMSHLCIGLSKEAAVVRFRSLVVLCLHFNS